MLDRRRAEGLLFLAGFALCIPAANWLIGNVGTKCVPNGPCLMPVGFGVMAPSGVIMIGLALVLRDLMQRLSWARRSRHSSRRRRWFWRQAPRSCWPR
jgi:hypothetical protein